MNNHFILWTLWNLFIIAHNDFLLKQNCPHPPIWGRLRNRNPKRGLRDPDKKRKSLSFSPFLSPSQFWTTFLDLVAGSFPQSVVQIFVLHDWLEKVVLFFALYYLIIISWSKIDQLLETKLTWHVVDSSPRSPLASWSFSIRVLLTSALISILFFFQLLKLINSLGMPN